MLRILPEHSSSLPIFHRCAPTDISCYSKFAEALVTFVSDDSTLHRLIAGVMTSKEIIVGLCLLALGSFLHTISPTATLWFILFLSCVSIHCSSVLVNHQAT